MALSRQDLKVVNGNSKKRLAFFDRYNATLSPDIKQLVEYHNIWGLKYEPGDIIFFPGSTLHQVTQHKSDTVRKTFACNFNISVAEWNPWKYFYSYQS